MRKPEILEMMKHALGWPKCYRNRYAIPPGNAGYDEWVEAVKSGLAWCDDMRREITGGMDVFHVTDEGKAWVAQHVAGAQA